jgi:hypothetical protein
MTKRAKAVLEYLLVGAVALAVCSLFALAAVLIGGSDEQVLAQAGWLTNWGATTGIMAAVSAFTLMTYCFFFGD